MAYIPRAEQSLEELYPNLDVDASIEISFIDERSSRTPTKLNGINTSINTAITEGISDLGKQAVPDVPTITVPTTSHAQFGVSGYIGGVVMTPRHLPLKHTQNTPKPAVRNKKILNAKLGYVNPLTSYESKHLVRPDASMEIYRPFTNMLPQDPLNLKEHLTKCTQVEYDIDEADLSVLGLLATRFGVMLEPELFEVIMSMLDLAAALLSLKMYPLEKKAILSTAPASKASVNDGLNLHEQTHSCTANEENRHCAVCNYAECTDSNTIVFCDGCDVAVHQDCYGVHSIPEGRWLCSRCESKGIGAEVDCYLCPRKSGAFKRSTAGNWVHMVCALWTPVATVPDNTSFLEPIRDLEYVDRDRWSLKCYVCQQKQGACIQCAARNCYSAFHPSCAQAAGFYMTNYDHDIGEMLKNQEFLPVYCHRHSQAHAPGGFPQPKLEEARKLLADERQKQTSLGVSLFQARKYKYWRTSNKTLILPHAVVEAVMTSAKARLDLDLEQNVVEFLCRYWTIKKDSSDGVMFNRRMYYALEVAERRVVRAEQSEECMKTPTELISIVEELLAVLDPPKQEEEAPILSSAQELDRKALRGRSLKRKSLHVNGIVKRKADSETSTSLNSFREEAKPSKRTLRNLRNKISSPCAKKITPETLPNLTAHNLRRLKKINLENPAYPARQLRKRI